MPKSEALSHSYTHEEIDSRFERCKGKKLGEIDKTGVFSGKARNKGVAGAVIEQSVLGYPADSRQEPDIQIDGVPYEVKTTGLIHDKKDGRLSAKEPMSVTAVSVDSIWKETFETSAFWHKVEHLLLVYYLYNNGSNKKVTDTLEYAAFPVLDYELHEWSEQDRAVLESDWRIVCDFVERVHVEGLSPDEEYPKLSHELNRQLMYTDTSPKWPNRPRWRLKRSTVSSLVRRHFYGELDHLPEEYASYADLSRKCQGLRAEYAQMTVGEIAQAVGYDRDLSKKNVNEGLVVRMFGGTAEHMEQVDVFAKAGVHCKTVVQTLQGRRTEDTKLFRIDLSEITDADATWEDSTFSAWFSGRILCAVFVEPSPQAPLCDNVFLGFKWLPDGELLGSARAVWEQMRRLVFENTLVDVPELDAQGNPRVNRRSGVARSAPNWPKSADGPVFVRGSGRDANDKPEVVNGIRMYRQYLWLRGQWVIEALSGVDLI